MSQVTQVLRQIEAGDPSAAEELLPLVYAELRKLAAHRMAQEVSGHTLDATGLVHEAYVRLVESERRGASSWSGRGHFFAAAAEAMRRILVERARRKKSLKGGGAYYRHELADVAPAVPVPGVDVLALNDALEKLERTDRRRADLVKLRFFAGLTIAEAAQVLGIKPSAAVNRYVRAIKRLKEVFQGMPGGIEGIWG